MASKSGSPSGSTSMFRFSEDENSRRARLRCPRATSSPVWQSRSCSTYRHKVNVWMWLLLIHPKPQEAHNAWPRAHLVFITSLGHPILLPLVRLPIGCHEDSIAGRGLAPPVCGSQRKPLCGTYLDNTLFLTSHSDNRIVRPWYVTSSRVQPVLYSPTTPRCASRSVVTVRQWRPKGVANSNRCSPVALLTTTEFVGLLNLQMKLTFKVFTLIRGRGRKAVEVQLTLGSRIRTLTKGAPCIAGPATHFRVCAACACGGTATINHAQHNGSSTSSQSSGGLIQLTPAHGQLLCRCAPTPRHLEGAARPAWESSTRLVAIRTCPRYATSPLPLPSTLPNGFPSPDPRASKSGPNTN